MRTTIDLDDVLFKRSKAAAALKGITLKEFIAAALAHELEINKINLETRRVKLPLVPSKRPGSLAINGNAIAAALEREDVHVFTGH